MSKSVYNTESILFVNEWDQRWAWLEALIRLAGLKSCFKEQSCITGISVLKSSASKTLVTLRKDFYISGHFTSVCVTWWIELRLKQMAFNSIPKMTLQTEEILYRQIMMSPKAEGEDMREGELARGMELKWVRERVWERKTGRERERHRERWFSLRNKPNA